MNTKLIKTVRKVDFNETKGFATYENAEKKAIKVLQPFADAGEDVRYLIHIASNGRYVPVAITYPTWALAGIAQAGVCLV